LHAGDLVMCDFDGTISVQDTGLLVFNALALEGAWEIEHRWRRGEIDSMTCLAQQWALVQLPEQELLALIDTFPLDPDFRALVALCRKRHAGLVVVSDGLDFYVDRMLSRAGFVPCDGDQVLQASPLGGRDRACSAEYTTPDPAACIPRFVNHAAISDHTITIQFPYRSAECQWCGNCKTSHLFRLRRHFRRVIYVGDGYSDMCPARYADVVFAKDDLAEFCRRRRLRHRQFENLAHVVAAMT